MGEGGGVAEDDEFHAGAGHGYIHAAEVGEEAYLSVLVGANEGDEDDVSFLALEAIDGIDADEVAHLAELGCVAYLLTQVVGLHPVGGDDAYVDALVEETLFAYAQDV